MLPFTYTEFLAVFAAYNSAIWPLPVVATALGIAVIVLLYADVRWGDQAIATILAAFWLINGVGYHWLFFADVNPAATAFGVLFIAAAAIFITEGVVRRTLSFDAAPGIRSGIAALLVGYGLVVYPLVAIFATHPYPATPLFGVAPCPTTIFTLGVLLAARHPRPWRLAGIPVLWCVIGGTAALVLRVPEDWGLFAAALLWIVFHRPPGQPDERPTRPSKTAR